MAPMPVNTSLRAASVALAAALIGTSTLAAAPGNSIHVEPAPSALACLQENAVGPMTYPQRAAEQKIGGIVRVRLTFSAANSAPDAQVFFDAVGNEFRIEVLDRVARYRLPCLKPGDKPVVATQEFQFVPGDGRKVLWGQVRSDTGPTPDIQCLTGAEQVPLYPQSQVDRVTQGTVLAEFTFTDGSRPPDSRILFDGRSPRFASVVQDYIRGYRLPCMKAGDEPVRATQTFSFKMGGEGTILVRDVQLARFLAAVEGIGTQKVRFDFTTMACPFQLTFVLFQPYASNGVGEIERSDPNRREFIEWLKTVRLKFNERALAEVLGDSMTIAVPCAIVDLT